MHVAATRLTIRRRHRRRNVLRRRVSSFYRRLWLFVALRVLLELSVAGLDDLLVHEHTGLRDARGLVLRRLLHVHLRHHRLVRVAFDPESLLGLKSFFNSLHLST